MKSYESYLGARNLKLTEKYKLKPKLQQLGEKKCSWLLYILHNRCWDNFHFPFDNTGSGSFFEIIKHS